MKKLFIINEGDMFMFYWWHKATIWTSDDDLIVFNWTLSSLGTNISEIWIEILRFAFKKFSFKNVVSQMAFIFFWGQCVRTIQQVKSPMLTTWPLTRQILEEIVQHEPIEASKHIHSSVMNVGGVTEARDILAQVGFGQRVPAVTLHAVGQEVRGVTLGPAADGCVVVGVAAKHEHESADDDGRVEVLELATASQDTPGRAGRNMKSNARGKEP